MHVPDMHSAVERSLQHEQHAQVLAGVKYIQFSELIAGQGPADISTQVGAVDRDIRVAQLAAWAHMCGPFSFTSMRRVAYRNLGLQVRRCSSLCGHWHFSHPQAMRLFHAFLNDPNRLSGVERIARRCSLLSLIHEMPSR